MKIILLPFLFVVAFQISKSQSLSQERVAKIKSATVRITIDSSNSVGSGFFINAQGLVVTCFHVIQPAIKNSWFSKIYVELGTGEIIEYGIITRIAADSNWAKSALAFDYCLLAPINPNPLRQFSFLKLGNFDNVNEGDEVYTCGYPIVIKQQFITRGIVSTKYVEDSNKYIYNNRVILAPRTLALLDITLNRGNSGGAVIKTGKTVNDDEVIGIAGF